MRIILVICVCLIATSCYADRVCIEKATGKLIEMQSGNAPLGTLTKNAVNAGYDVNDVEEKYVNDAEWAAIKDTWITQPAKVKAAEKEAARKITESDIRQKLNLSEKEFKDLKEALSY